MNSTTETDVKSDVDLARDTIVITTTETRTQTVEDLFDGTDGRLVLWEDGAGWNGFEIRKGDFYDVNWMDYRDEDGGEYIHEREVTRGHVVEKIENHIEDPHAGGEGRFVTRCSPP